VSDLRAHLDRLAAAGDLATVDEQTHWADVAAAVAGEAARTNGPAVRLSDTGGRATLVGGAFGGPDRLAVRSREPWGRIGSALGVGHDAAYLDVLDTFVAARHGGSDPDPVDRPAATVDADLRGLGLPAVGAADVPIITLGVAAVPAARVGDANDDSPDNDPGDSRPTVVPEGDRTSPDAVRWVPVRGSVHGSDGVRLSIPALGGAIPDGTRVAIALGTPPAALFGATMRWLGESHVANAPRIADALGSVEVAPTPAGAVPAGSEVLVEATVSGPSQPGAPAAGPSGPAAPWESAVPTATLRARVDGVRSRKQPIVPFSPIGAPMADGRHLLSIAESARLYARVNNYWGVSPAEWLALPPEAGLGICLVASDVLYAGFEWQLANTLFSFSRLFDKVVVLDTETPPMDLGHAFDDIWVKAHPANDWEFSDSEAPAARAPHYRRDGATGSNMYVDAAWDPRWDEEYIAPRVTFEATYPEEIREAVRADWTALGFDHGPEYGPERGGDTDRGA
jgi:4-hydroxy-3-polyprenylbenzoate decarboxylase